MASDAVYLIALLAMAGLSLYFLPRIRAASVPMQWGLDGRPTWYAPKAVALWGPLGFALFVRLIILAAGAWVPDKVHHADLGLILFSIVAVSVHLGCLIAASRLASDPH